VCTFEEDCLFDDDLSLKERWIITKSTVRKWDNTLNVGMYLVFKCSAGNLNTAEFAYV